MTQPPYPPPGQQHYQHYMPQQPPSAPKKAKKWPWIVGGIVVLFVIGSLAQPKAPAPTATPPASVAVTVAPLPAAAVPTAALKPPTSVKLPEVKGRNGGIVYDELIALGLTKLQLASRDVNDTVVLLPANWTAVKIEPAAGTTVRSDQTVVVTMTKG